MAVRVRRVRRWLRRVREDYRGWHVDRRCRMSGCDCPCGYCRHDLRHQQPRLVA